MHCFFCLTQNQSLFFPIFPFVSTCEGVVDALEEVAGCQCNFLIINSHDAAHLIHAHHVKYSQGLFIGAEDQEASELQRDRGCRAAQGSEL